MVASLQKRICILLFQRKSKFCNGKSKVSDGEILRHRIWLHCPPAPPWNFTSQKSQPSCGSQQKQSYCNKIPAKIKLYGDFTNSVFSAITKSFNTEKNYFYRFLTCFCKISTIYYLLLADKMLSGYDFYKTVVL